MSRDAHVAALIPRVGVLTLGSQVQVSAFRQFVLSARCAVAGVSPLGGGSGEHRFSLLAVAFGTSSFGVWSSRRCRLGELTLGWCVPASPG